MIPTRWFLLAIFVAIAAVNVLLTLGADADLLSVWLVFSAAPTVSLFVVIYGFTVRWWEFWIGRALMVSSLAFALLVDISLAYKLLGDDYQFRDHVRVSVYALVSVGAALKLYSILVDKVPLWTGRRRRRRAEENTR